MEEPLDGELLVSLLGRGQPFRTYENILHLGKEVQLHREVELLVSTGGRLFSDNNRYIYAVAG